MAASQWMWVALGRGCDLTVQISLAHRELSTEYSQLITFPAAGRESSPVLKDCTPRTDHDSPMLLILTLPMALPPTDLGLLLLLASLPRHALPFPSLISLSVGQGLLKQATLEWGAGAGCGQTSCLSWCSRNMEQREPWAAPSRIRSWASLIVWLLLAGSGF